MQDDPYVRPQQEMEPTENRLPDDLIDEIDQAIGEAFGSGFGPDPEPMALEAKPEEALDVKPEEGLDIKPQDVPMFDPGMAEMQGTFVEMVKGSLNPVARYMKAISLGEHEKELLEISELIVTPLIPKVEAVGLNEHAEDLSFFRSLLILAQGEREASGRKAMKEVVMEGFTQMSDRFGLSFRGYRLAVRNLVEFYRAMRSHDAVSEEDVRKFFAIGVPSLTWVRRTRVKELSSLSGISSKVMTQIRKIAYEYRSVTPLHSARLARDEQGSHIPVLHTPYEGESVHVRDVEGPSVEVIGDDMVAVRGQA